jgi:hypothetical protein
MHLDFYIYDILDFYLLLGLPLEKLLASHGSLDEKLRETGSATAYISVHINRARSLGSSRIL